MSVTGAPVEVEIDGKSYTFHPLRFTDLEWLETRMRARAIEVGRLSLPEDASQTERDALMQPIIDRALGIDLFSETDQLFTPVGMTWMLWRMTRQSHPDVTMDDVLDWVRRPDVMNDLVPKLKPLMGAQRAANPTQASVDKHARSKKSSRS